MPPILTPLILIGYFGLVIWISKRVSVKGDSDTFFTGNKRSPWYVVSFGMIGAAISGVTFISLPGTVKSANLYFGQFIFGNIVGYLVIAFVLIPLYYRLNLVSIYGYLTKRFGLYTNKTGAAIFIISQSFGAGLRMLLAIKVLQVLFFDAYDIPLFATASLLIAMIWFYTQKAGIKVIVWTDLLQTLSMLLAVVVVIVVIVNKLDFTTSQAIEALWNHPNTNVFQWDINSPYNFWKQFISGVFISITMMGMDQNMMQKSLTCPHVKDAQKNVLTFSISTGLVQLLFLLLGLGLYLYIEQMNLSLPNSLYDGGHLSTDKVFPYLASHEFGLFAGVCFLIGIIAASLSSADSSLTSLTTSFSYDFMKIDETTPSRKKQIRRRTHIIFSLVLLAIVMIFSTLESNIFTVIFKVAGYTYGPLLGLFLLGIGTNFKLKDRLTPYLAIASPVLTYLLDLLLKSSSGFDVGFLVILINALIFILLSVIVKKAF